MTNTDHSPNEPPPAKQAIPVSDPKHATHITGKGRYYQIPGIDKPLISVTNAIGVLNKYGLAPWYAKLAAEYAIDNLPALINRVRTDRQGAIDDVKAAGERARDEAGELGTRVHDLAEAHVLGRTLAEEEIDRDAGLYVKQYLKFLDDFDLDIASDIYATEMTVYSEHDGWAGTLDLIPMMRLDGYIAGKPVAVLPDGQRHYWLVDIKTSRTRAVTQTYPQHGFQLAALRHAKHALLPDDTAIKMPPVYGCATLQLRQDKYEMIPVPATTAHYKHFLRAVELARFLHNDDGDGWPGDYDYRPITPTGKFKPKRGSKNTLTSPSTPVVPDTEAA